MGAIRNICTFMIDEGDIVLGIAPQFSRFISEVELQKGIYKYYSLKKEYNYKFNVKEFIELVTDDIDMIYIDNPNNPTGQIIELNDIDLICKISKEKGIYVLIDEAYGDYMQAENSSINLINKYNNLIVIKSASKVYGLASERVGYVIASEEIINIYDKVSVPFPFGKSAMTKFIKVLKHRKRYTKKNKKISKLKKRILESIDANNYLYTSMESPIFTIKSDRCINLAKEFANNNIMVEGCACFVNLDEKYVRVRINKNYKKMLKNIIKILK